MDSNLRFRIPERDEDLLVNSGNNYHVEFVPDAESALDSIDLFCDQLRSEGWWCLKEYFDSFFAVVKTGSDVDSLPARIKLAYLLKKGLRMEFDDLASHLTYACESHISEEVVEESTRHSDSILMYLYFLGRLNTHIESQWVAKQREGGSTKATKAGKGKKARSGDDSNGLTRWPALRNEILELLLDLLELEVVATDGRKVRNAIKHLWRPCSADPGLIKTITRVMLDWLANPEHKLKSSSWLVQVFRLLVPLCTNYHQYTVLGAVLLEKTIHLEYAREAYPFVEAIQKQTNNSKYPQKNDPGPHKSVLDPLLSGMISQVALLNPAEFNASSANNSSRPLVNFIQTVSYRAPHLMIRQISSLMRFLTEEPWQLRAAVLTAISDLICSTELEEQVCLMDPIRRDARDKMLTLLKEHLKDSCTQVRSKVTSLWKQIADEARVPAHMIDEGLLEEMGARLEDKLVSVRKPAISFFTTFLRRNPYGHDFSFNLNCNSLRELLRKRESLRKADPENGVQWSAYNKFQDCLPALTANLENALNNISEEEDRNDDDDGTENYFETLLEACAVAVVERPDVAAMGIACLLNTNRYPGLSLEENTTEEIIDAALVRLETAYIQFQCTEKLQSEDWLLNLEQNKADHARDVNQLEFNIWWMRTKIHMEMSIAESLQFALRGALQGDSAELKEAINFIIQCKNFMIRGADEVVRVVFSLIWRNNTDIQKEVISAAKQMFISTNTDVEIAHKSTAENMLSVLQGVNEIERCCVEEVIVRMAATPDYQLPDDVIKHIFHLLFSTEPKEPVNKEVNNETEEVVKGSKEEQEKEKAEEKKKMSAETKEKNLRCIKLLAILAQADPESSRSRLRVLQRMINNEDAEMTVEALDVIAVLGTELVKEGATFDAVRSRRIALRLPQEDSLFKDLEKFFFKEFLRMDCPVWGRVVRGSLKVIFGVGRDSSVITSGIVSKVLWHLGRAARTTAFYEAEGKKIDEGKKQDTPKGKLVRSRRLYWRELFDKMLERTLIFAGEVSLRVFVYVDTVIIKEMKKLQEMINVSEKEPEKAKDEDKEKKGEKSDSKDKKDKTPAQPQMEGVTVADISVRPWEQWEVDSAMRQGLFTFLQMGVANKKKRKDDDGDHDDGFNDLTNLELARHMQSTGLLGRLIPLVNFCVRAKGTGKHARNAAASAFVKMIPISQQYAGQASFLCMLLMTASSDPQIRENILVAMPDIYQFVSLPFDNYQSELFNMCRDVNAAVRETALLVLLYVTADGIVQSRSGVADVARCFVDPVEDISIMTKVFFTELSRKKNTIANAMPDFLSRLSRNPKHIPFEDFKKIMTFLFEFLEDGEIEDLVPRVLTRVESIDADSLRRNPDIASYLMFCLQWLAKSEKAFYKIRDSIKMIEPFLHVSSVMDSLMCIMDKMKKVNGSHPDFHNEVARFVDEVQKKHSEYSASHKAVQKASAYQRRVEEAKRRRARNKMAIVEEEEDSD